MCMFYNILFALFVKILVNLAVFSHRKMSIFHIFLETDSIFVVDIPADRHYFCFFAEGV